MAVGAAEVQPLTPVTATLKMKPSVVISKSSYPAVPAKLQTIVRNGKAAFMSLSVPACEASFSLHVQEIDSHKKHEIYVSELTWNTTEPGDKYPEPTGPSVEKKN